MERDIDSRQWDGGEASFKFYVPFRLLLGIRTLEALCNNIAQHFLNFLDTKSFRQLEKVNIMHRGNTTPKHTWRCRFSGLSGNSAHWSWFAALRARRRKHIVGPT